VSITGNVKRVVVAPDKFKGTLTAREVAHAMAAGARRIFPEASFDLCPLADGGDGTIDALVIAGGGEVVEVSTTDPLGKPIKAPLGLLSDGRAVVEMASVSGLALLDQDELDPCGASSRGTGDAIREAAMRSKHIIVGIGGSASTDGGTGAARAIGWRFLDPAGNELPEGGCSLVDLARIDATEVIEGIRDRNILVIADVTNPLIGADGAARVYGPQKGATEADVELLDEGLRVLAERIKEDLGIDVADVPGAGAAGGTGAGLIAFFAAELRDGFELIAAETGVARLIDGADLVLTGEGKLDRQTLSGKVPIGVARVAKRYGVECVVVAGQLDADLQDLRAQGVGVAASVVDTLGSEKAFGDPAGSITRTVEIVLSAKHPPC
jgi:glycerate 2-kinase